MATFHFPVQELSGSPEEKIEPGHGFLAKRRFLVPWNERFTFVQGLYGNQVPFGSTNRAYYPGQFFVRVRGVSMQPFVPSAIQQATMTNIEQELASYLVENDDVSCLVTVDYQAVDPEDEDDEDRFQEATLMEYRRRFSGEYLTTHGRMMTWEDDGRQVAPDAHPSILIPLTEHIVTFFAVINPPWEQIQAYTGFVNRGSMTLPILRTTAAPETLLFSGCNADRETTIATLPGPEETPILGPGWTLQYVFKEKSVGSTFDAQAFAGAVGAFGAAGGAGNRAVQNVDGAIVRRDIGWNHALREKPAGWVRPLIDLGNPLGKRRLYERGELDSLFRFNQNLRTFNRMRVQ